MNKGAMLDAIKMHLKIKKNTEFADFLGISSQAISNWYSRNTFDAELIYTKCLFLNPAWLLTGKGNMLNENSSFHPANKSQSNSTKELIEKICTLSAENALLKNRLTKVEEENKIDHGLFNTVFLLHRHI